MTATARPASIGGYPVERELGAGGMGRVLLCRDTQLDRPVAIKVLLGELLEPGNASANEMRIRFLREARALARVSSPHVVAVHAVGEDPVAGPFVVMEYLQGEDLHARLQRDVQVSWRDAARIGRDAVAGLAAAESAGIVHRDIKPANIFIVQGRAKLTDFGLAREVTGSASITQSGIVVGTPAYLAPEVIKGAPATHSSDLYALAATLYHIVAGRPPFTADAPLECLAQALSETPPRLDTLVDDCPPAFADVIERGLKKEPHQRPPTLAMFDADLKRALDATAPLGVDVRRELSDPRGLAVMKAAGRTAALGSMSQLASQPQPAAAPSPFSPDTPVATPADHQQDSTASWVSAPDVAALPAPVQPPLSTSPAPSSAAVSASEPTGAPPSSPAGAVAGGPLVSNPFIVPTGDFPARSGSGGGRSIKTSTLTVMMTDIAGYTERTSRVSREESARWMELHDALLTPCFKAFGGKVRKTLGDAFLVTFASPTDAVLCACAIQDRLWLHNQQVPLQGGRAEDAIHVRIALSAGEVRLHKGDVFGEPVNLAARLEAITEPGEVLLSDAVYATMNTSEVRLASRGEHVLKGIGRSVHCWAAVADDVAGQPPFGGRALSRVHSGVVDVISSFSLRAVRAVDSRVIASLLTLVFAIVVGAALAFFRDDRLERIARGDAKAVISEIEAIPVAQRSPDDVAMLGHALLASDDKKHRERAFGQFAAAAAQGKTDSTMLSAARKAIEQRDDHGAAALMAIWPDDSIVDELRALVDGDAFWPRNHALAALEVRKLATDEQRVSVGMRNLAAENCGERKLGVNLLKAFGRGSEVLSALKKLGTDPIANHCFVLELPKVEAAVKKRS